MKLYDYMQAHEGEPGMTEKLSPANLAAQGIQLSDDELEQTTGGSLTGAGRIETGNTNDPCRWDSKGRTTHWAEAGTGRVYYYACPRCKRVTHLGTLGYVYCDPCDTYWNRWAERRVYIN